MFTKRVVIDVCSLSLASAALYLSSSRVEIKIYAILYNENLLLNNSRIYPFSLMKMCTNHTCYLFQCFTLAQGDHPRHQNPNLRHLHQYQHLKETYLPSFAVSLPYQACRLRLPYLAFLPYLACLAYL